MHTLEVYLLHGSGGWEVPELGSGVWWEFPAALQHGRGCPMER
jgi:hypothetical protein